MSSWPIAIVPPHAFSLSADHHTTAEGQDGEGKGMRPVGMQPDLGIIDIRGEEQSNDLLPINGFQPYVVCLS